MTSESERPLMHPRHRKVSSPTPSPSHRPARARRGLRPSLVELEARVVLSGGLDLNHDGLTDSVSGSDASVMHVRLGTPDGGLGPDRVFQLGGLGPYYRGNTY